MATKYKLERIPPDVFKIIVAKQNEIKLRKGTLQYSFEATIHNIVREWDKMKKEKETVK